MNSVKLRMPENDFSLKYYFKDANYYAKYKTDLFGVCLIGRPDLCDVLCVGDGKVADISGGSGKSRSVTVAHDGILPDARLFSRYLRLSAIAPGIIVGKTVKGGETLGYQGKSGPDGERCLEFQLWLAPKDEPFVRSDARERAVDPFNYLYLFPGQRVSCDVRRAARSLPKEAFSLAAGSLLFVSAPENTVPIFTEPSIDVACGDGFLSSGRYAAVSVEEREGTSFYKIVVNGEFRFAASGEEGVTLLTPCENGEMSKSDEIAKKELEKLKTERENLKKALADFLDLS